MRGDKLRLGDVIEAIAQIQKHTSSGREKFDNDELIRVWVVHHIQIIGEALSQVSDEVRIRYPQVQWAQIIAMRNIVVHAYFGVDFEAVWNVVENNLSSLKTHVETMIENLPATDNDEDA